MSINPLDLAAAAEGILNHQSMQQRERLLAASAQASRQLLGSPDAMKVMPEVLRLLGEAAQVDRTALAFSEVGPNEKRMKIRPNGSARAHRHLLRNRRLRRTAVDQFCSMLMAGKSIVFCPTPWGFDSVSITSDKARTSAVVPIIVEANTSARLVSTTGSGCANSILPLSRPGDRCRAGRCRFTANGC
jgi:hypothetical protein